MISKELVELIDKYIDGVTNEFRVRWEQWPISIEQPGPSEVTVGLLRRQYGLSLNLATNPNIWNAEIAPIILRCMVEVYITLAWILEDPVTRSGKYIEYGLGQEKLIIKHRNDEAKDQGLSIDDDPLNQESIRWLENQKFSFFVDINLGSWSGIDARKMAEEANCQDFYRYTYPRFSTVVHSTWNHISRIELQTCANPLHGGHKVPRMRPTLEHGGFFELAAKYLDKTFNLVDRKLGLTVKLPSTYRDLLSDIVWKDDNGADEDGDCETSPDESSCP